MNYSKKYPKADLRSKRNLYFSYGLIISMSLTIMAFEWRFENDGDMMDLGLVETPIDTFIDNQRTIQPPPPPPVIQQPVVIEVPDDVKVPEELKVIFESDPEDPIIDIDIPELIEEEAEKIFNIVEQNAAFAGGIKAYAKYLRKNLKYPNQARRMGIEGKVYVQFVIDKKGNISEVVALKRIGGGCDEEAVRVIKNSPAWSPGKQRGRPVKQRMVIPIVFKLG